MKRDKKPILITVGIILALLVVVGGYFYNRSKQNDHLANEKENYRNVQIDTHNQSRNSKSNLDIEGFADKRQETNALTYLAYVANENDQTPKIEWLHTFGGDEWDTDAIISSLKYKGLSEAAL